MHKTRNLSRALSLVLAFCLSVALLPAQAFAATKDDDPATWPAPDSHYTAPDKEPVYLMVDYTDEENGGVAASHHCTSGATLEPDIVKATATTNGHVKYTCDSCGSWAQIDIPMLTLDAFELDPAYLEAMTNGVEYSGSAYTVVYNVARRSTAMWAPRWTTMSPSPLPAPTASLSLWTVAFMTMWS